MKTAISSLAAAVLLGGASCLLAGPQPLDAKDSKVVQQPVVEPLCNWTGFYIGIHGGYGWGEHSLVELDEDDPAFHFEEEGFFGGGQVGFNLQLGSFFVIGVEGEFAGADIDAGAIIDSDNEITNGHIKNDWTGTGAGRVGLSFCKNRLLAYAKGGVAFAHFEYNTISEEDAETWNADHTRIAPLVGFGLEYAFTCHWSVKVEYKHLFLEDEDVVGLETDPTEEPSTAERTFHIDGDQDLIEAGVNFRF